MRDETRKRYERWLGKPGEKIEVAAIEEEDFFLGRMLKQMREYRLISLEDLAEGICNRSDLEIMEKGMKASLLIAGIYLGRMGRSIHKFEFYFAEAEYEKQHKRDCIVKLWKENCLNEAQRCLEEYVRRDNTKYDSYWRCLQECCIALRRGKMQKNNEIIWGNLENQRMYFLPEELDFMYELAEFYGREQEPEKAQKVYERMYENTLAASVFRAGDESGMDEERRLEILPELCLRYGYFERVQGRKETAMRILDTAVELLYHCMRTEWLKELLKERIAAAEEIGGEAKTKEEKAYRKMCEDMQNLLVLDLVCQNTAAAKKKLYWLKEAEWENTILDNLSAALERLSD